MMWNPLSEWSWQFLSRRQKIRDQWGQGLTLHVAGWFPWSHKLVSLVHKLHNNTYLTISLLNQNRVLTMGQNISQRLIVKNPWFATTHGWLHSNVAVCSKSIPNCSFFSMGKGENWGPIHKLSYIFKTSGSCHILAASPPPPPPRDCMIVCLWYKGRKSVFWDCLNSSSRYLLLHELCKVTAIVMRLNKANNKPDFQQICALLS